jgi:hypothetical protein
VGHRPVCVCRAATRCTRTAHASHGVQLAIHQSRRLVCLSSTQRLCELLEQLTAPPLCARRKPQLGQFNQLLAAALKGAWVVDRAPLSANGPPRCWCSAAVNSSNNNSVYVYAGRDLGK